MTSGTFAIMASGCATIVHGTTQTVPLRVDPQGSKVSVYRWSGETLGEATSGETITLRRPKGGQSYLVKVTSEGRCPRYTLTQFESTPIAQVEMIIFLVTLGIIWLIPVAIDNATGASYAVDTPPFEGSLEEVASCNG